MNAAGLTQNTRGVKDLNMPTTPKPITKSAKLANVCYDIRGPVMEAARQMEEDGVRL
jgi:hypothetical protein